MSRKKNTDIEICAENRKARHDYFIEETLECGIELKGNEVKSIKESKVSIKESWVDIKNNQLIIKQMHVTKYETARWLDTVNGTFSETRDRRLLAHKREILRLSQKINTEGYTLVPLKMYLVHGKVKVEIALAKGKHSYDKRESLKEKQVNRDISRALRERR